MRISDWSSDVCSSDLKRLRQAPPNGAAEVEEGLEALTSLIYGFGVLGDPMNIVYMFVGIQLGVLIAVLPGLGGANGVAILLPLTFSMSSASAIIMLSCIYRGDLFVGRITSVLFTILRDPGDRK